MIMGSSRDHHCMADYVNLLARAVAIQKPTGVLRGALLEDLVGAGGVLRNLTRCTNGFNVDRGVDQQLAYDLALIRLCEAMDISTAPDRFSSPATERRRLEGCLAALGPNWRAFIEALSPHAGLRVA